MVARRKPAKGYENVATGAAKDAFTMHFLRGSGQQRRIVTLPFSARMPNQAPAWFNLPDKKLISWILGFIDVWQAIGLSSNFIYHFEDVFKHVAMEWNFSKQSKNKTAQSVNEGNMPFQNGAEIEMIRSELVLFDRKRNSEIRSRDEREDKRNLQTSCHPCTSFIKATSCPILISSQIQYLKRIRGGGSGNAQPLRMMPFFRQQGTTSGENTFATGIFPPNPQTIYGALRGNWIEQYGNVEDFNHGEVCE